MKLRLVPRIFNAAGHALIDARFYHDGNALVRIGEQLRSLLQRVHGGACNAQLFARGSSGDFIVSRGKGIRGVRSSTQGDLLCHVVVETPVSLTARQKELLVELEAINQKGAGRHNPRAKSWMDKVKEFFAQ